MKLRSGKVIHYKKLPDVLETYINNGIQAIKNILPNKMQEASELLGIIGSSENINYRSYIADKINEIFKDTEPHHPPTIQDRSYLSSVSGALIRLIAGNSVIYDNNKDIQPY